MDYWNKKEKKIGVLGLSPYATIDFLRKLADVTPAKKDWEHIRVLMDLNTKIPSRGRALDLNEEDPTKYMNEAIKSLCQYGADLIIIPCNTAHYYYKGFTADINVPVLNIIEETSSYIKHEFQEIRRIGIIASLNTVKYKLYDEFLTDFGIEVLRPKNQREVSDIIEEVKIGNDGYETKLRAKVIAQELIDEGAQGIILGCTEIPLIITQNDLSVPSFDTNQIIAKSCVKYILNKTKK